MKKKLLSMALFAVAMSVVSCGNNKKEDADSTKDSVEEVAQDSKSSKSDASSPTGGGYNDR